MHFLSFGRAGLAAVIILGALNPLAVSAADNAMQPSAMQESPTMATMICRSALPGEKPSANIIGSTAIVCRPIAIAMKMSDGKMMMIGSSKATPETAPFAGNLTAMQLNDAYVKFFEEQFNISRSP